MSLDGSICPQTYLPGRHIQEQHMESEQAYNSQQRKVIVKVKNTF